MRVRIDPNKMTVYGARLITALWAFFWIWLELSSGLGKGLTPGGVLLHATIPCFFFVLFFFLAGQTAFLAGWLFVSISIFIATAYPIAFPHQTVNAIVFVLLTMALPPFTAGLLFLVDWRSRKPGST